MKKMIIKSGILTVAAVVAMAFASCKENKDNETEDTQAYESVVEDTDNETDTIVTQTDSITRANRMDDTMSTTEQVP